MTEEQFEEAIEKAYWEFKDNQEKIKHSERDCFKYAIRSIFKKSPLRQKVEEAEEMYKNFNRACAENSSRADAVMVMNQLYSILQLFKEKFPEWDK